MATIEAPRLRLEEQLSLYCPICTQSRHRLVGSGEPIYRCQGCGLLQNLRSRDCDEEEERYLDVVFDTPVSVALAHCRMLGQIWNRHGSGDPGRLLDLGCGSGSFLVEAERQGWSVAGVDISKPALDRARQRVSGSAMLHLGKIEDLPVEAHSFDVITLWDVFDHLENPTQTLKSLRNLLSPGGLIVFRLRNSQIHLPLRNLELFFRRLLHRPPQRNLLAVIHRYGFSVGSLKDMLSRAGFGAPDLIASSTLGRGSVFGGQAIKRFGHRLVRLCAGFLSRFGVSFYPDPSILFWTRPLPLSLSEPGPGLKEPE